MLDYRLKIGLIPIRRDALNSKTRKNIFGACYAIEVKEQILPYIKEHFADEQTEFCDLEWLNEEGLLYDERDVPRVRDHLLKEQVDAIFLLNCNFGNEEAAGQIARAMGLPTLLWGPQDSKFGPDGARYTDTQCGLFAIGRQLNCLKVPFSYIENCPVESPVLAKGIRQFYAVATAVKNFRKLRITQVGTRLNPFKSVMINEYELAEKFGFNMQTVNMAVITAKLERIMAEEGEKLQQELKQLRALYDTAGATEEELLKMLAFVLMYTEVFEDTDADVLTSECWTAMPIAFGANPCLAMSLLADRGYIVTCESDVHGAITQALLQCLDRGKHPALFGEFTCRNPQDPNSELLWHCGPFPPSACAEGEKPHLFGGKPAFRVADGTYTIARFQGDSGNYRLLGGSFKTTAGPETFGTYMWAKFKNWPAIERKMVEGPYIHHMSEIRGDHTEALAEFCKYIPGLTFDQLEGE